MPPMISVQHTSTALPRKVSMMSPKARPRITAGKKATSRLRTKAMAPFSKPSRPLATSQKVRQ